MPYEVLDDLQQTIEFTKGTNNVDVLRKKYDSGLGYENFHLKAKEAYQGEQSPQWEGYEKIPVFDKAYCKRLITIMENRWDLTTDHTFRRRVVNSLLTNDIDNRLKSFFHSEYLPLWMRFYKNDSAQPDLGYSFFWHCDAGPRSHLKLLVYLNSSQVTGANTYVLERPQTEEFERIGYVFCPLRFRLSDLTKLAEYHSIKFQPDDLKPLSGDGLLFEPSRILHKGEWPKVKKRYMIQILFIPSIRPWSEVRDGTKFPVESNAFPTLQGI